ncbi:MAG: hypothetical protein D6730_25630, partial [Bacteroidetes bacterium]
MAEAVFSGRKGVGIDINPASIFICNNLITPIDPNTLYDGFTEIKSKVKEKINSFYAVQQNGNQYIGKNFLWEGEELKEIRCASGGRKNLVLSPLQGDVKLANSFKYEQIINFYPSNTLFHNSRINAQKGQKISELFTPRNLMALSVLYEAIEEITDEH